MINIIGFLLIFTLSNRYLYILSVKVKTLFLDKEYFEKLEFSFEEPVFLISLPTNDYKLYTSLPKDFRILYDFKNFLFPELVGIKVFYKNKSEKKMVFYIKYDDLSIKNKVDNLEKYKIFMIFNKKHKSTIKQEICKKLRERTINIGDMS